MEVPRPGSLDVLPEGVAPSAGGLIPHITLPQPIVVCHRDPQRGWRVQMMIPALDISLVFTADDARDLAAELTMAGDVLDGKFEA